MKINFNSWKTAFIITVLWFALGVTALMFLPVGGTRSLNFLSALLSTLTVGVVLIAKALIAAVTVFLLSGRHVMLPLGFTIAVFTFFIHELSGLLLVRLKSGSFIVLISLMVIGLIFFFVLIGAKRRQGKKEDADA